MTQTPPQDAESCHLIHALLKFYLDAVFKNYPSKAAESKILKSFSTLANNFIVIVSKLQPSVSRTKLRLWPVGTACFQKHPLPHPLIFPDRGSWVSWKRAQALGTSNSGGQPGSASNQLGDAL